MAAGVTLVGGMLLISPNGQYRANMQADGNFAVTFVNSQFTTFLWATGTSGNAGAYLNFQTDANLVLCTSTGVVKWSSSIYSSSNSSLLSLQMYIHII
jgi:hypothetical protein